MPPVTLVLGPESDDRLRTALREVLISLGAKMLDHKWGVAGSQEIELVEAELDGHRLFVEAETYVGLSITGPAELVHEVQRLVTHRIAWSPLLSYGSDQALAMSWTGEWLVGNAGDRVELSDPRAAVRLLVLLEADPASTIEILRRDLPPARAPRCRCCVP